VPPPLTSEMLMARRAASRRRRVRRRALIATMLAAAVIAAVVASTSGGSSVSRPGPLHTTSSADTSAVHRRAATHKASYAAVGLPSWLVARDVNNVLAYTPLIHVGSARARDIALTFDDGPSIYTPRILHVLAQWHVPATFFVIGREAKAYPQFVRAEARAGNEVGDHTETHPPMSALPAGGQQAQIVDAANAIRAAGAPSPHLWRPPYGLFNSSTISILHSLKMLMVMWTVDTRDYARPGVSRIQYIALSGARPGAIILMHDGGGNRSETVAALPKIIAALRRRGFKLVTVPQLLADDPPPHNQTAGHRVTGGESGGPRAVSGRSRAGGPGAAPGR
jgi:peptidoglycan-N-acetylglucosamine deacetylase